MASASIAAMLAVARLAPMRLIRTLVLFELGALGGHARRGGVSSSVRCRRVAARRATRSRWSRSSMAWSCKSRAQAFRGGSMLAWFGGIAVDLREATLAPGREAHGRSRCSAAIDGQGAARAGGSESRVGDRRQASRTTSSSADDPAAPTLTVEGSRCSAASRSARSPPTSAARRRRCAAPSGSSSRFPSGSCERSRHSSGGTIHETAELVLPRLVRRSRLYEATAKNLLRITVELVGGVERPARGGRGRVRAVAEEARRAQGRRQRRRARVDLRVRLLATLAARRRGRRHPRHPRLPRRARRRAEGRGGHRARTPTSRRSTTCSPRSRARAGRPRA